VDRRLLHLFEGLVDCVERCAPSLLGPNDARGKRLAEQVAYQSAVYNRMEEGLGPSHTTGDALAARLRFFLPRDVLKSTGPLAELAAVGALPTSRTWRVLDIGAGLGATTFGAALFAVATKSADAIEVRAADRDSRALDVFERLADEVSRVFGVGIRVDRVSLDAMRDPLVDLGRDHDFVFAGLVLNELDGSEETRAEWLVALSQRLAGHGSLIVIEPALRLVSRSLHVVRDLLTARQSSPHVFAPCIRSGPCPMLARERDWCHEEMAVHLPERVAALARQVGLREQRLTYSYLTLRRDHRSIAELVTVRDHAVRVVSRVLRSKGKIEVHTCGEQGAPRLMLLDRERTAENEALAETGRGTIVELGQPVTGDLVRLGRADRVRVWRQNPLASTHTAGRR